ncbi:MAG: metallophosphoesterase [Flaviaesturariibacter sp.]|nr:metallophosphoesterase [Flaviaesturariibacter sp.]
MAVKPVVSHQSNKASNATSQATRTKVQTGLNQAPGNDVSGRLYAACFHIFIIPLLRFVAISDTHCRHKSLKLPKGDAIIHSGDLTYKGKKEEVLDFLSWFKGLNYTHKIFIAGNHDFFFEKEGKRSIEGYIPSNIIYLNDSGTNINGINIWGSPITPWHFDWAFNKKRGRDIARHWNLIPSDTDLLITHGPPYSILDQVLNERPVGDRDLLKRVGELKPKVHVFGHIHEAYGKCTKDGTRFYNVCNLNEHYELVNPPTVFDL